MTRYGKSRRLNEEIKVTAEEIAAPSLKFKPVTSFEVSRARLSELRNSDTGYMAVTFFLMVFICIL